MHNQLAARIHWVLIIGGVLAANSAVAQRPAKVAVDHARNMRKSMQLFRTKVRRILLQHCHACHGGKRVEADLNLTTRKQLLQGGERGPAVKVGEPERSLLVRSVRHAAEPHMPLDAKKLPDAQVKTLAEWVRLGAAYDRPLSRPNKQFRTSDRITAKDRSFWSFRPLNRPQLPPVMLAEWTRNSIDRFIVARLQAKGLKPSPAILSDRAGTIRRVYLNVLGLPPTPEEISSFVNDRQPTAYARLIDRVLASPAYGERWSRHWLDVARFAESYGFEHDLDNAHAFHYRDFVIRALNQDLDYRRFVQWQIAGDEMAPQRPLARLATGFLAAGVHNADIAKVRVELERYDELDDMANTIGVAMLGLSIGCARCHNHKYDPITQRDYYRFIACFARTIRGEVKMPVFAGGKQTTVLIASEGLQPLKRMYNPGPAFFDPVYQLRRGDPRQKTSVAKPGLLSVLSPKGKQWQPWKITASAKAPTSLRRSAAARWLVNRQSGAGNLLARVIVNRIWQHHFGVGIVETPNDFGARGARPSHPLLLEWLASELVRNDWQLKPIHRLILGSATYLQSRRVDAHAARVDPQNRLLWRSHLRRVEAEVIRDSLLHVAGELDRRMYGPGTLDESSRRRSIYFTVKRSQLIPLMTLFDQPAALQSIGRRVTTTVAPQALTLMNSPHVNLYAERLAQSIRRRVGDRASRVRLAFLQALGRQVKPNELARGESFLVQQARRYQSRPAFEGSLIRDESLVLHLDAGAIGRNTAWWANAARPSQRGRYTTTPVPKLATKTPRGRPAVRFDGKGFYRFASDSTIQFGTGDFSFSVLFRMSTGTDFQVFGKDSYKGKSSYTGYFLQVSRGQLRFATRNLVSGKGPVNYLDSRTRVQANRWVRVSGVRRAGMLRLYVHEALAADVVSAEARPTNVDDPTPLKVGEMDDHPGGHFRGDIAELLLYNRALSSQEIRSNHAYLGQRHLRARIVNAEELALTDLCQALFCLNEFIYPR